MPAWDATVSLALSSVAIILLVLIVVRYRSSRGMKLALYSVLALSSAFRLLRAVMAGGATPWIDVAALVFFGYAAVGEAIPLLRSRAEKRQK